MELYSTYIETDKFDEVVNFYEKVFEKIGSIYTRNRWVEFDFGNKLSIYNKFIISIYLIQMEILLKFAVILIDMNKMKIDIK